MAVGRTDAAVIFDDETTLTPMPICIYCRATTTGDEPPDHPIPQALGTHEYALPPGAVCTPCNGYLGANLDQNLCDHHHLAAFIVLTGARGSRGRTRTAMTPDLELDPVQGRLNVRARKGEATFVDNTLTIQSEGNRQFDGWKFSRGLHRVALGLLAQLQGPDAALDVIYDPVRAYIRSGDRRVFRRYYQRIAGQLGSTFHMGIARADVATLVYLNFSISEFVVALNGKVNLTGPDLHRLAVESGAPVAELAPKEWLVFERATGQPSSLPGAQ